MKKLIFALILFFSLPAYAITYNLTTATAWNDIVDAIEGGLTGDIFNLADGEYTATSGFNIPANVHVIGGGAFDATPANNTVITSATFIEATLNNNSWIEGIRFENGGALPVPTTGRQGWVIKNNYFGNTGTPSYADKEVLGIDDYSAATATTGVYHGNYFYGIGVDVEGRALGVTDWFIDTNHGGLDKIFLENNTFDLTDWDGTITGYSQISDVGRGSGWVHRFNNLIWGQLESHGALWDGVGAGTNKRGARYGEVYLNLFSQADSTYYNWNLKWTSGPLLTWGNKSTGYLHRGRYILKGLSQEWNDPAAWNTDPHPGDAGDIGYRDFPGMGKDVAQSLSPRTTVDQEDQTYEPIYFWNNTHLGTQKSVIVQDPYGPYIIENRDFFQGDETADAGVRWGTAAERGEITCTESTRDATHAAHYDGFWTTDEGTWNKNNAVAADDGTDHGVGGYEQGNGILYRCDPGTTTWTAFYTPAEYPHPLLNNISVSGTVFAGGGARENDIVTGGIVTIEITLTGATWHADIASAGAQFDALQAGLDSDGVEVAGWDAVVKANLDPADVVRNSDTKITITLGAEPTFAITANETVTITVAAACTSHGEDIVATPSFTVSNTEADVAVGGGAAYNAGGMAIEYNAGGININ